MLSGVRGKSEELLKACCYEHLKKLGGENKVGDQCDCPFFVEFPDSCNTSPILSFLVSL
jgi:hypothetical protein